MIVLSGLALCSVAQEPPAQPTEPVAPAAIQVAPGPPAQPQSAPKPLTVTPDTSILRRTPVIDGTIEDGEWDVFYALAEPFEATTYADWDSQYLYLAARCAAAADFAAVLDANADGWFNGPDNYEFAVTRGEAGVVLTVSRFDSAGAKQPTALPVSPGEAALVEMKSTSTQDALTVEMRIPSWLIRDFKLVTGRKIGLQMAFRTSPEAFWTPSVAQSSVHQCELVSRKMASLKPLLLGFDLLDTRVARGDELVAKFHVTNDSSEEVDVRQFVLAGEGKSGDYLSSQKVRMDGLSPRKHVRQEFRSIIPRDMPLGTWAIGAEVRSADARLGGALVSFEVVEPFTVELRVPDKPVRVDVKDVTFTIIVRNNMRRNIRGQAKITLPQGWELWRDIDMREFASRDRSFASVPFKAKPPLGSLGEVSVSAEVTVEGITKTAEGRFSLVNP